MMKGLTKAIEEVRLSIIEQNGNIEEATNMYTDDITGFQIDRSNFSNQLWKRQRKVYTNSKE